jgi:hypothetical protein
MPNPLAIVTAATAVVGGVVDFLDRQDANEAREEEARRRGLVNKRAVLRSLGETTYDVRLRQQQERRQAQDEITAIVRASFDRRGAIAASAGSANVAGASVGEALLDERAQEGRAVAGLRRFQRDRDLAARREIQLLRVQARNRVEAVQPPSLIQPSPLGAAANIASLGLAGFASGLQLSGAFGGGRRDPVFASAPGGFIGPVR